MVKNMLLKVSAVLLVAVAANAASLPFQGKIVNGWAVLIESFPYQAAMLYYGEHICGGSIIGPRHVLTASHCVDGIAHDKISVRVGSTYHGFGGQVVNVDKVIMHEAYDPVSYENDVTLLVLDEDIIFSESAQPITMTETEPEAGQWCDVSGWGALTEGGESPINLQMVQVPAISRDVCNELYPDGINETMICAGFIDGVRDACQGDSGGPLASDKKLVGVVSWGIGCARPSKPGVYSNVATLRGWIRTNSGI